MCIEGATLSKCMPFKDPCLITAQVLSVIALILSFFSIWAWWVMLSYSLPAFILMQVAWCCAMNRCGFIAAGVLALLVAAIDLAAAIFVLIWLISFWEEDCDSYSNSNYDYDCWEYDENDASLWMNLSFASALLWLITGILVLCFGCGKRYQDIEDQLRAEGGAEGAAAKQLPSATSVPITATRPMQQAGTNTTTITHMPDGSVERKSEVFNPDGSKTVSVVVEKPPEDYTDSPTSAGSSRRLHSVNAGSSRRLRSDVENGEISPTSSTNKPRVSMTPPVQPKVKAKHKHRESAASNTSTKKNSNKNMSYDKALKKAQKMEMAELKKECQQRGIYTKSFFEKAQFEEGYANSFSKNKH